VPLAASSPPEIDVEAYIVSASLLQDAALAPVTWTELAQKARYTPIVDPECRFGIQAYSRAMLTSSALLPPPAATLGQGAIFARPDAFRCASAYTYPCTAPSMRLYLLLPTHEPIGSGGCAGLRSAKMTELERFLQQDGLPFVYFGHVCSGELLQGCCLDVVDKLECRGVFGFQISLQTMYDPRYMELYCQGRLYTLQGSMPQHTWLFRHIHVAIHHAGTPKRLPWLGLRLVLGLGLGPDALPGCIVRKRPVTGGSDEDDRGMAQARGPHRRR